MRMGSLAVMMVAFAACGGDGAALPTCVPGAQRACACTSTLSAVQICLPNGTFAACACDADAGASTPTPAPGTPEAGAAPVLACDRCPVGCCLPGGGCSGGTTDQACGGDGQRCADCPSLGNGSLCRNLPDGAGGRAWRCYATKRAGAACADADECDSGVCDPSGRCAYPCAQTGYTCGAQVACCSAAERCEDRACCVPVLGKTKLSFACCPGTHPVPLPTGGEVQCMPGT